MMRRTYIKKEAKCVRNEGAGAGMLINVGDIGGSQKITAFKANPDGTYTLDVDDVVLNNVCINTYYWSSPDAWDGIKCKLSLTLRYLDDAKYERQLQNRLAKMKTQPKTYGIYTYEAGINFGTLSCGGGWSHMSLDNGFDAEAYASSDLYDWRNMGSYGDAYVIWNGPDGQSIEDDFEIVSVYVDAGTALEDLYRVGEEEYLVDDFEDLYLNDDAFSESLSVREEHKPSHKNRKNESMDRNLESVADRLMNYGVDCEFANDDILFINVSFDDIDDSVPVMTFRVDAVDDEHLEITYMDFRRYALDNDYMKSAISDGVRTVYDLCEYIEERGKEDSIRREIKINRDLDDAARTIRDLSVLMVQDLEVLADRMRKELSSKESRCVRNACKNEATDAATKASSAYYSLMNLFPRKSVNSSWMKCATPTELKSATWWNDLKAAINDISNMPGVTVEYRSENGAKTFAQFQKVVKSCANRYKYDDYELQLEQDYSNDRIFISGGLAAKLSWDEIIISFTSVQEARRVPRRVRKTN